MPDLHASDQSDLEEMGEDGAVHVATRSNVSEPVYGRTHSQAESAPMRSHTHPTLAPSHKFRSAVRRVIHINRTSTFISNRRRIGSEPGVDPRRKDANLEFGHLNEHCAIEVIDYSSLRCNYRRLDNREFVDLLESPDAGKGPWTKVRWINICGISWASSRPSPWNTAKLHPLALEDVLSLRGASTKRSKADYYKKQLFIRIQCHMLSKEPDVSDPKFKHPTGVTGLPRSSSPFSYASKTDVDSTEFAKDPEDPERAMPRKKMTSSSQRRAKDDARKERVQEITVEELKKAERVHVKVSPMFIFLLRNGTVVSMTAANNTEFTDPIAARVRSQDSVLRTSADPSLLVQSLLDLVVDKSMEVVDAYHTKILKFEHDILVRPKVDTVKYLHILSGDLILHTRTLEPIKTMIFGLRRYDLDRCAALIDADGPDADAKVVGYFSQKAKVYLADVYDHMDYILTSLDMYGHIAENLVDYTFNLASYQMNQVMWRLTAVTIICLPLTLLTGYFGMNFEQFWAIRRSDAFFWYLAAPLLAILTPILMHAEIKRGFEVLRDKALTKKIDKTLKNE